MSVYANETDGTKVTLDVFGSWNHPEKKIERRIGRGGGVGEILHNYTIVLVKHRLGSWTRKKI